MAQKEIISNNFIIKRSGGINSSDRFIFGVQLFFQCLSSIKNLVNVTIITLLLLFSLTSCGEPDIRLSRTEKRIIDTLVNHQLDSIGPMLDSICFAQSDSIIQHLADSIILERRKKEERLRSIGSN